MDTRSVEATIVMGQNMQTCHLLRCKLLADNKESLGTSFSKAFKVESGHFGSLATSSLGPSSRRFYIPLSGPQDFGRPCSCFLDFLSRHARRTGLLVVWHFALPTSEFLKSAARDQLLQKAYWATPLDWTTCGKFSKEEERGPWKRGWTLPSSSLFIREPVV